jgi:glycosyltransferase involved in cell wall biosynthesis
MEDFQVDGQPVSISPELQQDPQVSILNHYFADGEYVEQLQRTSVMLLPYRLSSYALRGSRVVVEAVSNGIPVIVTEGTTLAATAKEFGAAICCRDGDAHSLARAIAQMESCFGEMRQRALEARKAALERFSVREFRRIFQISASLAAIGKAGQTGTGAPAPTGQIR